MVPQKSVHSDVLATVKNCWPEFSLISALSSGMVCFGMALIGTAYFASGMHRFREQGGSITPFVLMVGAAVLVYILYLATAPYYYGIRWFYTRAAEGTTMPMSSLFACYSSRDMILRCIRMKILSDIAGLIRLIPGAAVCVGSLWLSRFFTTGSGADRAYIFFVTVVIIAGLLITQILRADVIFAPYIFVTDMSADPFAVLKKSREEAKRKRRELIASVLSVFPLVLLVPFVFPMIFLVPYVDLFYAVLFKREEAPDEEPS